MIIICPEEVKKDYLNESKIHNYKFYTLGEIKDKVFFKYADLALYEVSSKYKVKPKIAFKILNSLYYLDQNKDYSKLKYLSEIKEYLIEKSLIIQDDNFLKILHDEIIIDGYPLNKELTKIIDILSKYTKVTYKELKTKYELNEIYCFESIDSEIEFVCENILELINKGIDINKIVLINYNDEYLGSINKIFTLFKIPYKIKSKKSITMFPLTKKVLKFIKNSDLKISELNEYLTSLKGSEDILKSIISVLNKYYKINKSVKELYEIIYYDLKNMYLDPEKFFNVVNIYNGFRVFPDDFYVFAISLNEETKYKDNDYLTDLEKASLNIDTSSELNEIQSNYDFNILSNIKNLYLSYKIKNNDNEYVINSKLESLEIKNYDFKHNAFNYNQYLFGHYQEYDNSYQKIEFDDLKKYLDDKINLSYSSMDQFFRCKFRFFLNNILKLEPSEETMATRVGSMFHKILERSLKNNYENYLEIIDEETINYLNHDLKEKFYANKLKKEAVKIIERLKSREEKTDFKNFAFEKYLEINKESKINVKIVGFIDKILVFDDGINNYIIVFDYKTGSFSIDLAKVKDGLNMQLLVYLYLIMKTDFIKKPKIAGAYIEHILDELKSFEFGKTYAEIEDNRLEGYTTNNREILSHIDKYYDINSYIKGIRVKTDGDFYANASVYSERNFAKLLTIVENNINEMIASIENCDFEINPKRYLTKPDEIVGCEYCPFKEVCYVNAKNIKIIEKTTVEEMLGEENEVD